MYNFTFNNRKTFLEISRTVYNKITGHGSINLSDRIEKMKPHIRNAATEEVRFHPFHTSLIHAQSSDEETINFNWINCLYGEIVDIVVHRVIMLIKNDAYL